MQIYQDNFFQVVRTSVFAGADPGFGQGGAPGPEAEGCQRSEAKSCERSEQFAAGVQGPGSF